MARSDGTLLFRDGRLVLEVDPGIVEYARAVVPPHVRLNRQKHAPHVTVVSGSGDERLKLFDGVAVRFTYDPRIVEGEVYWWLRVRSAPLLRLREALGLPRHDVHTRPPDGSECFHITVGNVKT